MDTLIRVMEIIGISAGTVLVGYVVYLGIKFIKSTSTSQVGTGNLQKILKRMELAPSFEVTHADGAKSILKFNELSIVFVKFSTNDYGVDASFCEVPVPLSREEKRNLTSKCLDIINIKYKNEIAQQQEILARL